MMIKTRTCTVTLALLAMALTPGNALLRGSAPQAGDSSAKAKVATAIDRFQALVAEKAPWGLYDAAHWSAAEATLSEASQNGKTVISEGTIKHGSGVGHGAKGNVSFILGGTTSKLFWPDGSIPWTFTICSITRYTGGSNQRVLQASQGNWFHGHWNHEVGVACYDSGETAASKEVDSTNWVVMCGSTGLPIPKNILYDGVPIGTGTSEGRDRSYGNLAVNPTTTIDIEPSDWAISVVAIWDQHLAAEEMQTASDALMEYLATGRRILEAPTAATDINTVTTVSGPSTLTTTTMGPCNVTTTTIASNATTTTTTSTVSCPE
jgi:hypothetical protein